MTVSTSQGRGLGTAGPGVPTHERLSGPSEGGIAGTTPHQLPEDHPMHRRPLAVLAALLLAAPAGAVDFTVNDKKDAPDAVIDGVCATATGVCSLRAAIQEANATAGAGMLRNAIEAEFREVKSVDRIARYGHPARVVRVGGREALAKRLERRIFDRGGVAAVLDRGSIDVLEVLANAGVVAILVHETADLPVDEGAALDLLLDQIFTAHDDVAVGGEGI